LFFLIYNLSSHVQDPNIYHVKTAASELKDSDFSLSALEKNLEKEIKLEMEKKNINYLWSIPMLRGIFFYLLSWVLLL
jgi:hypothetical protein